MKPNSIENPTQYLIDKFPYVTLESCLNVWSFRSYQYVQDSVKNVIDALAQEGGTLTKREKSHWNSNYRPETDTYPDIPAPRAAYYKYLIGVLQCITELGIVDITMEISEMAYMIDMPREVHLKQLFHMFAYLRIKHNRSMVFDTTEPDIDEFQFVCEYWYASAYSECKE